MEFEPWMIVVPLAILYEIVKRIWWGDSDRGGHDSSWYDDDDSGFEIHFDFDFDGDGGD